MGVQHEEAQHLQVIFLADLADGKEVAKGLGHLPVVDIQERVVHPVFREFLSVAGLALGNLVFMMGENQILSARMDVDLLAQVFF